MKSRKLSYYEYYSCDTIVELIFQDANSEISAKNEISVKTKIRRAISSYPGDYAIPGIFLVAQINANVTRNHRCQDTVLPCPLTGINFTLTWLD